ncbi:MAG: hypothetical protein HY548_04485 [Elusimicrobia bacterium]|nr:hypothetical protein [Elusimicrobiota bacterium]
MLIVHVTTTDPAGSVFNFINAVNSHTKHRARLITTMRIDDYGFSSDIADIYDGGDEIEALLLQADVIHLHKVDEDMTIDVEMTKAQVFRHFKIADILRARPSAKLVYHIHGHPFERANPKENGEMYAKRGRPVLASTPDLEEMYRPFCPRVQYFPNCVPINDVRYLPRASNKPIMMGDGKERLCVAQSPTHAILKNVHLIQDTVQGLSKHFPVFYLKIWNCLHDKALRHKRNAHVVFDHMEGYYGLSSLEALSMGKPTIAGLSDYTQKAICDFFGVSSSRLPWQIARSGEGLRIALSDLLGNEEFRNELGEQSRKFMEEVWSDRAIGQRLAAFYESL